MKFNKFHGMFCSIRRFVHEYEMTGRILEKSNEAFNATLANVKSRLRCMPTTSTRIETTNARTQANLNGEVLNQKVLLQDGVKGKKRGPYKARVRTADEMTVSSVGDNCIEFKGKMYLKLVSGNLLPKEWEDHYNWFGSAIAPRKWKQSLASTAPSSFSGVDREREGLTQF